MGTDVSPPVPNEDTLTTIVARDVALPNGRVLHMRMSEWHWAMVEFLELWNEYYRREAGLIYEFHKNLPNVSDEHFSNVIMTILRDDYEDVVARQRAGEQILDPRV